MLSEQLQSIREARKTSEVRQKPEIQFVDAEDMDDEALMEMIPFGTKFTGRRSIYFQRDMLTAVEESRFRTKIAGFLRSCFGHMRAEGVEYFLEYMCRKFLVHTFNPNDLAFILLPFPEFYATFVKVRSDVTKHFVFPDRFSYVSLANLFVGEALFAEFVFDYFEHYDSSVECFLKSIALEACRSNHRNRENRMRELVVRFEERGEHEFAVSLQQPERYIESPEAHRIEVEIPNARAAEKNFESVLRQGSDRRLLYDTDAILPYFTWLLENNVVEQSSFTLAEVNFVRSVLGGTREMRFASEEIAKIFGEINFKLKALKLIYEQETDCTLLFALLNQREQILFCNWVRSGDFVTRVLSPDNYAGIIKDLDMRTYRKSIPTLVMSTLHFPNFCVGVFKDTLTHDLAVDLFRDCLGEVTKVPANSIFTRNLVNVLIECRVDVVEDTLKHKNHFIRYLAATEHVLSDAQIRTVLAGFEEDDVSFYVDIVGKSRSAELINEFVSVAVDVLRAPETTRLFLGFAEKKIEDVYVEHLEKMVKLYGFTASPVITKKMILMGHLSLKDVIRSVVGRKRAFYVYRDLPELTQNFLLCLVSNTRYRNHLRVEEAVPLVDILANGSRFEDAENNNAFIAHTCLYALAKHIEVKRITKIVIGSKPIFVCLPALSLEFPAVTEILIREGLEERNECVHDMFDLLIMCRSYRIANAILGEISYMNERSLAHICGNLSPENIPILIFVLEKLHADAIPFLSTIVDFCVMNPDDGAKAVVVALMKRYGNILHPHLPKILGTNMDLFGTALNRVETRLLLRACIEGYKATRSMIFVGFMAGCLAKMMSENQRPSLSLVAELTELVEMNEEFTGVIVALLKCFASASMRDGECLLPIFKKMHAAPEILLHVTRTLNDSHFVPMFIKDIVASVENRDYACLHVLTFCLGFLDRKMLPREMPFVLPDLCPLIAVLLSDLRTLGSKSIDALVKIVSIRPDAMDVLFPMLLETMKKAYSRAHVELLTHVFKGADESMRFAKEISPYITLILNNKDADIVSSGRLLVDVIEERIQKSVYMLFD